MGDYKLDSVPKSDSIENILEEVANLRLPDPNIKRKAGRPPGSKNNNNKKYKRKLHMVNNLSSVAEIVNTNELTREEKLLLLSNIARNSNSNSPDIIKAIMAHTEMIGEQLDGITKLILRVEIIDPNNEQHNKDN